ncbi:MAG: hypothetical protein C0417_10995 [Chlorobiaceae bacterium]|nr:hypothetical protein [Chlorobiaceae bacterium]
MFSSIVPLFLGLYYYGSLTREIRILVFYIAFVFVVEISVTFFVLKGINNLWILHFYIPVEYILLVIFFSYLQKNRLIQKVLLFSIPIFIIISIVNSWLLEGLTKFPSHSRSIESVVLIGIGAYTLFELSKNSVMSLLSDSRFWIVFAILLYSMSTLLLFALSNTLAIQPMHIYRLVWSLLNFDVNIISNFLYAGGILCQNQAQRSGLH